MEIKIPKIVRPLFLREYAEGFGEEDSLWVWVNPPRGFLRQYDELFAEILRRTIAKLQEMQAEEPEEQPKAEEAVEKAFEENEMAALNAQLLEWFSKLWSQGPKGSGLTTDEVKQMVNGTADTDPAFFQWLRERSLDMIRAHRQGQKKD